MRHPSSQAFFAIWDRSRGFERAPLRSDLPPEIMREWLGDMFMLSLDASKGFPLRMAGTRVCALLGGERKGHSLLEAFAPQSRDDLTAIISEVADELLVAVAGVNADANNGRRSALELSLLPFRRRAHVPPTLIGLLVPMTPTGLPVHALDLTSWRYLGHPSASTGPRPLRRTAFSRGLTVYEGLDDRRTSLPSGKR